MLQKSGFQEKFVSEDTFAQIQGFETQTDALSRRQNGFSTLRCAIAVL